MVFESESQLSVRCFKCGCFGHRGLQCENYLSDRRSQNSSSGGMLEKCWICGCLGHIAVECKEKTVTCFSCGQRGHKQEDCTSPMANCWNCGERGHIKKDCPVKKNVGMCFYCHQVGHHSKDCDQKVCYICESKGHLWTRCPLKGLRGGFQHRTNGYTRRMRHVSRGQDHQKAFQPRQFSNQLLFDNQYYQSFEHQQQTPRCIRPKSDLLPLSTAQERTIAQERTPMPLRRNSDIIGYSAPLGPSLEPPHLPQSMDDFELVLNQSSVRSMSPQFRSGGLRSDQEGSGFSMADVFSRSDESSMKVTESEKDSSTVMPLLDGCRKSLVQLPGLPSWGSSSEVWSSWDTGLRVELSIPEAGGEGERRPVERHPVQDQEPVQPAQETQTVSSDVRDVAAADTTVGNASNVIDATNPSPTTTSTSAKEDVKSRTLERFVPKATGKLSNSEKSSKTESRFETQESDLQEELKRVREQLAEAKTKLVDKEEQLDKTQKMVQALKDVMYLESVVKKKFCPNKDEHSTKGEDVSNRCANCIQILKNLESCEECTM